MAKKGLRTIVVRGDRYHWRVAKRPQRTSDWRVERGAMDPAWEAIAEQYGLGAVASIAVSVRVRAEARPAARLTLRYAGKIVDGFLGPEQLLAITPSFVRACVERALDSGWGCDGPMHLAFDIVAADTPPGYRPVLLALPEIRVPDGYGNAMTLRRIR